MQPCTTYIFECSTLGSLSEPRDFRPRPEENLFGAAKVAAGSADWVTKELFISEKLLVQLNTLTILS